MPVFCFLPRSEIAPVFFHRASLNTHQSQSRLLAVYVHPLILRFSSAQYVRNLAAEIGTEFHRRQDESAKEGKDTDVEDLFGLVSEVIPFHMKHNAEPEAVDLLIEVERLDLLAPHVNEGNYARTCLYLFSCSSYLPEPEDSVVLKVAHEIFMKVGKLTDAMRVACRLGLQDYMEKTFIASNDKLEKRQLCYMLARHGHPLRLDEGPCEIEDGDEQLEPQRKLLDSGQRP